MIPSFKAKYNGFICIFGYELFTFVAMGGVRNFAPMSFVAQLTILVYDAPKRAFNITKNCCLASHSKIPWTLNSLVASQVPFLSPAKGTSTIVDDLICRLS
jgi:hypothetical protein